MSTNETGALTTGHKQLNSHASLLPSWQVVLANYDEQGAASHGAY